MKSLAKYAMFAALLTAAVVEAQSTGQNALSADIQAKVDSTRQQIEADNRHVLHLQAVARKEKDVIKLTCINDKMVQLKAQQNLFDAAVLQLDAVAVSQIASQGALDDMNKVGLAVKKLRGEADGCAGELELYKQESNTSVDRPELDDPTDGEPFMDPEQIGEPDVDVPAYATPFR